MSSGRDIGYKATLPFQGNYPNQAELIFRYSIQIDRITEELKHLLQGDPIYPNKCGAAITNSAEIKVEKIGDRWTEIDQPSEQITNDKQLKTQSCS